MPAQTFTTPLFRLLTPLLQSTSRTTPSASTLIRTLTPQAPNRNFTITRRTLKKANPLAKKGDPRISLIRYHLQHPKTPRPLRFSRLRALRHWTIHRAWMLLRRKKRETEELELYRLHQSMHSAMEELRTLDSAGQEQAGRLYRVALEKRGIFNGENGVPIEYARTQTDTPGRAGEVWNHGWTR